MESAEQACAWLCQEDSKVSCHYLVDETGEITQMVSEDKRAWHAGVSSWQGNIDVNSMSIGIEIANPGHSGGYPDFAASQMDAVVSLSKDILSRWNIKARHVLAHSDVAPGRKIDPGEKFDWHRLFLEGIGLWVPPAPIEDVAQCENIFEFQSLLKEYGYNIEKNGVFDLRTKQVTEAFQRHFRPARVDGVMDTSTLKTLRALLASV